MHTCQCKGCQMGQNNGALLKEVAAFRKCPLIEMSTISTPTKREKGIILVTLYVRLC